MSGYDDIKVDLVDVQAKAAEVVRVINNLDSEKAKLDGSRSQAIAELNAHQGVLRFLLEKLPEDERRKVVEGLNAANVSESPVPIEESVQDDF